MEIYKHRNILSRTLQSIKNEKLVIGFIGGSITEAKGAQRWPEAVVSWFVEEFPDVRIVVENAAIGGTGSDLAVFRSKRDILDRNCDLVFVEYSVNDKDADAGYRMRTREGLIRQLLADEGRDVVIVYSYSQDMYKDITNNIVPSTIEDFEQIAEHYGLGSVWMGLYALEEIKRGRMRWEEWLPDGLHPQNKGSLSYAQSVIRFLEDELKNGSDEQIKKAEQPTPIDEHNWEKVSILPFSEVKTQGPWRIQRSSELVWIDQMLMTSAIGAKMFFEFEGRGLCLGFDFGKSSSEFRYRIDKGEWVEVFRERPDWCGGMIWYRMTCISEYLALGKHQIEIEVIHGDRPECTGTNFSLAFIGIIQSD